ncbi:hypothetical protein EZV76_08925 [Flagellimonas alvinocaridis]|uniref:Uncharacterized protein n=1 Tax=Flagellimonas alvinocaridis TaxID=2530200 RepID=A0A4S8RMC8_9FLAO|nr:hypothetical protein [Allomuricauda alvinocaridis]THV59678.1 hypothetical protein EZV76_08925 [Allomuricauda alvinocaridis]
MVEVQFGIFGKIITGHNEGWYVKLEDNTDQSGGFYIYEMPNLEGDNGFDTWLESKEDIKSYFDECNWKIEWLIIEK